MQISHSLCTKMWYVDYIRRMSCTAEFGQSHTEKRQGTQNAWTESPFRQSAERASWRCFVFMKNVLYARAAVSGNAHFLFQTAQQ